MKYIRRELDRANEAIDRVELDSAIRLVALAVEDMLKELERIENSSMTR